MSCWMFFGSKDLENTCTCSSSTYKWLIYTSHQITPAPQQVGLLPQQSHSQSGAVFSLYNMTHESAWAVGRGRDWRGGREGGMNLLQPFNLISFVRFRSCDHLAFVRNHMHLEWGQTSRPLPSTRAYLPIQLSLSHTHTHNHTRTHTFSLKAFPAASKLKRCSIGWMRLGETWDLQRGDISCVLSQSQCSWLNVQKRWSIQVDKIIIMSIIFFKFQIRTEILPHALMNSCVGFDSSALFLHIFQGLLCFLWPGVQTPIESFTHRDASLSSSLYSPVQKLLRCVYVCAPFFLK